MSVSVCLKSLSNRSFTNSWFDCCWVIVLKQFGITLCQEYQINTEGKCNTNATQYILNYFHLVKFGGFDCFIHNIQPFRPYIHCMTTGTILCPLWNKLKSILCSGFGLSKTCFEFGWHLHEVGCLCAYYRASWKGFKMPYDTSPSGLNQCWIKQLWFNMQIGYFITITLNTIINLFLKWFFVDVRLGLHVITECDGLIHQTITNRIIRILHRIEVNNHVSVLGSELHVSGVPLITSVL